MFKKRQTQNKTSIEDIDTLFGENTKVIGKVEGMGNIRIDGNIEGDIDYDGNIVIGETGKVQGDIKVGDISIAGKIKGNIYSTGKLTLLPNSSLTGDVDVSKLIIHEDAQFDGSCKMSTTSIENITYIEDSE